MDFYYCTAEEKPGWKLIEVNLYTEKLKGSMKEQENRLFFLELPL